MLRLRKAKSSACARIVGRLSGRAPTRDAVAKQMAQVTSAIHTRSTNGEATTLRQLHKISDLEQSVALKVVAELERAGVVQIERNLSDAFESEVSLCSDAAERFDRLFAKEAARRSA